MAEHHGGDWHSLSHTSPSLSLLNTQRTDTHLEHTRRGSQAQDEARLTAGMSFPALVTFLAVEIKYLRLFSNKKTHLSLNCCDSLP